MQLKAWLTSTSAGEMMTRDVVTLHPNEMLAIAADVMVREQISGAPVVDEDGKCIGVLSIIDVLHAVEEVAREQREIAQSPYFSSGLALPSSVYEQELLRVRDKLVPAAEHPIRDFMTTDLVTVPETATVQTIIQYLIDAQIHRVIVVDDSGRMSGLVSTVDVLAALQRAGNETQEAL